MDLYKKICLLLAFITVSARLISCFIAANQNINFVGEEVSEIRNTKQSLYNGSLSGGKVAAQFMNNQVEPNITGSLVNPKQEDEPKCELYLARKSISKFRHDVYYNDLSFVMLHLELEPPLFLKPSRDIVGESHWVWTFYGQHGGLEFLGWPTEFQIWSLGLLNAYVGGPQKMFINSTEENCPPLEVGKHNTDLAISKALVNLTLALHELRDGQYDPSFWCYRKRKFLNPEYLYLICKHIVCPFVAIKYTCCNYYYIIPKQHREVECSQEFSYDEIWWLVPVFGAIVLFSFCPLVLFNLAGALIKSSKESMTDSLSKDYVFLDRTDQVTLMKTLLSPVSFISEKSPVLFSRAARFFLPFLSLVFIVIQIYLDRISFPKYVNECVEKGVPMGFRSMGSGFQKSARNFLPFLGGPFVACTVYLIITCFLVTIPQSLFRTLSLGLGINNDFPDNVGTVSPIRLPFPVLERYGSLPIRKRNGYTKIYTVYVAQLNLLINIKFWKFVFDLQCHRWQNFRTGIAKSCVLPLYITLCVLEILVCLVIYGFPIVSFGITVFQAYRNLLLQHVHNRIRKPLVILASIALLVCVIIFLFMFCTIFLDACLFITRLCIFTYTGIILYPRVSYGYLIFVATVLYYLWDSIHNFSRYYFQLFRMTVSACESVQRANDLQPLVRKNGGFKGIQRRLFEDVIENYCPRRKKVIASFLKVFILLGIVGLSVHLLMKTNRFQDLHVIMHVGTTLLICAFPKIIKSICSEQNSRIEQQKVRSEIKSIVRRIIGFVSDDSDEGTD